MDEKSGRRLARSTAIFSLATGLSRILGLVREVVASYYFGAAGKINAFTVAFQVPNLVRALVADAAVQSAFVPVFTELLELNPRVPVVLSSGFAEQERLRGMLAKGLRGFIPKPYTQQKLLNQIRSVLDTLRAERSGERRVL